MRPALKSETARLNVSRASSAPEADVAIRTSAGSQDRRADIVFIDYYGAAIAYAASVFSLRTNSLPSAMAG